jgi:hypothetical protein
VNNELEGMWKEAVMAKLLYCAGIYWKELRKTMKNIGLDSQAKDLNMGPCQ